MTWCCIQSLCIDSGEGPSGRTRQAPGPSPHTTYTRAVGLTQSGDNDERTSMGAELLILSVVGRLTNRQKSSKRTIQERLWGASPAEVDAALARPTRWAARMLIVWEWSWGFALGGWRIMLIRGMRTVGASEAAKAYKRRPGARKSYQRSPFANVSHTYNFLPPIGPLRCPPPLPPQSSGSHRPPLMLQLDEEAGVSTSRSVSALYKRFDSFLFFLRGESMPMWSSVRGQAPVLCFAPDEAHQLTWCCIQKLCIV
jgi:hypothetical protein